MFVELVYGYLSNSLGLITDSFHMLFDCSALLIGLIASYIAKMPRDNTYTYGYARVETLSGLINGIFLLFVAFNVFVESIDRMLDPQHIKTEGLLFVSIMGFLVNLIGICFLTEGDHDGSEEENQNMQGVFLHVLADCLGSVGVIVSCILVQYYQLNIADPICSFIISLFILASGIPFIKMTSSCLILKASDRIKQAKDSVRNKISTLGKVKQVVDLQVWEITHNNWTGTA